MNKITRNKTNFYLFNLFNSYYFIFIYMTLKTKKLRYNKQNI